MKAVKESMIALDLSIRERIGDLVDDEHVNANLNFPLPPNGDNFVDDEEDDDVYEDESTIPDAEEFTPETFDGYLTASVMLPRGGEVLQAQVVARKRDSNGNPIGKAHSNPILDTREYEVEFEDGAREFYSANLIAECMYSQIDYEGKNYLATLVRNCRSQEEQDGNGYRGWHLRRQARKVSTEDYH